MMTEMIILSLQIDLLSILCKFLFVNFARTRMNAEPRGSPASGLLRCRVQPRRSTRRGFFRSRRTTRFTCKRLSAMSGATAWFSARGRLRAENTAFQPRARGAATLSLSLATEFYPAPVAKSAANALLGILKRFNLLFKLPATSCNSNEAKC